MEQQIRNHLKLLGCKSSLQISLAYQVYIELFDVKTMYDVELLYNETLEIPYLTAKISKDSDAQIFVPHSTSDTISMSYIEELQNNLCKNSDNKTINLACSESDSTIVFYTFTQNFVNLQNPEYFVRQKTREERKEYLENEIKKNKNKILVEAYKININQ